MVQEMVPQEAGCKVMRKEQSTSSVKGAAYACGLGPRGDRGQAMGEKLISLTLPM